MNLRYFLLSILLTLCIYVLRRGYAKWLICLPLWGGFILMMASLLTWDLFLGKAQLFDLITMLFWLLCITFGLALPFAVNEAWMTFYEKYKIVLFVWVITTIGITFRLSLFIWQMFAQVNF